jgi:hypothetical protein
MWFKNIIIIIIIIIQERNVPVLHEDVSGNGGIVPTLLTSALDRAEWSASRPCRFTPGERVPGTSWIEGRVGPRAGLDVLE